MEIGEERTKEVVGLLKSGQKTVLLSAISQTSSHQMLATIRSHLNPKKVSVFQASILMTEWDLLDHLSIELDLISEEHDHRSLEEKLCELLQVQSQSGMPFLCLIDEAHLMNSEVVEFVLHFAHESRLRLVLISPDSQLFEKYGNTSLDRWILESFSLDTTRQYLESRFNGAGIPLPTVFDESVIQWIYQQGKYDQSRMDAAALDVMRHTKVVPAGVTRQDLFKFLVCGLLVVMFCPGIYLWATSVLFADVDRLNADGFSTGVQVPVVASPGYPLQVSGSAHSSINTASVPTTGVAREDPGLQLKPAVQVERNPAESRSVLTLTLPANISTQWLRRMDPEFFTIQVIGSHSRDKIARLMASDGLRQGYGWFESRFQDRQWHVVIKGIYRDRDSARYEAASIKANTGLEPWVRNFRSIQADL